MSLQDGQYMWFYGASPEQQASFLAAGQMPPDYPMSGGAAPSNSGPLITFGDGGGWTQSEYEQYVSGPGPNQDPSKGYVYATPGVNAPGGRYNPAQAPLADNDPESFAYQSKHGPTSKNPDTYTPGTVLGDRAAANGYVGMDPMMSQIAKNTAAINEQNRLQKEAEARMQAEVDETRRRNEEQVAYQNWLINAQDPINAEYLKGRGALAEELTQRGNEANKRQNDALADYTGGLHTLNARNDATLNRYNTAFDTIGGPRANTVTWDGDLTSSAAIADPQALAAQNQALGQLQGAASGSLDYASQAAKAYADPKYVAMRDKGLDALWGAAQGSYDVLPGQVDPEAYASAMEAMRKMESLSDPAITDQERFLYEKARQEQEMDERGNSAAVMSQLRRAGMAGSGAQLTQGALTSQRISQNRLLSDLAASAGAVQRAQRNLESYGQLSSAMNSEANQLGTANSNRKLQALGLYEQGAETAQQASFDQEYKRGLAADQASRDNQGTRLQGMIASGNQANAMQDDAFNRAAADDQMKQYNRSTSLDVEMYGQNFEQRERADFAAREAQRAGINLEGSAQNSNNLSNIFNATSEVVDKGYARDAASISGRDAVLLDGNRLSQGQLQNRLGTSNTAIGVTNTGLAQQGAVIGMGVSNGQWTTTQKIGNNNQLGNWMAGEAAGKQAAADNAQAREDGKANGLLGTPILSQNGILGLKGVPFL